MLHILNYHPRSKVFDEKTKEYKTFKAIDPIGSYQLFACCSKNKNIITEMATQLGAGPSMFLIGMK